MRVAEVFTQGARDHIVLLLLGHSCSRVFVVFVNASLRSTLLSKLALVLCKFILEPRRLIVLLFSRFVEPDMLALLDQGGVHLVAPELVARGFNHELAVLEAHLLRVGRDLVIIVWKLSSALPGHPEREVQIDSLSVLHEPKRGSIEDASATDAEIFASNVVVFEGDIPLRSQLYLPHLLAPRVNALSPAAEALLVGERENILVVVSLDAKVAQATAHEEQIGRRGGIEVACGSGLQSLALRLACDLALADGQDVRFLGFDDAAIGGLADQCDWFVVDKEDVEDLVDGFVGQIEEAEDAGGPTLSTSSAPVDACQWLRWQCRCSIPHLAFAVILVVTLDGLVILGGKGTYRLIFDRRDSWLIRRGVEASIDVLGGRLE